MSDTRFYTEVINNTPVDVEVHADKTVVNIRGKVWTFETQETAQSAYDKIQIQLKRVASALKFRP